MRPARSLAAIASLLALGSHVAPLGLAFGENGAFIGQHGSGGFVSADGKAYGRPVGVALDRRGALLVADDVGNVIWRVTQK